MTHGNRDSSITPGAPPVADPFAPPSAAGMAESASTHEKSALPPPRPPLDPLRAWAAKAWRSAEVYLSAAEAWLARNSYAPDWLPPGWRRLSASYLAALVVPLASLLVTSPLLVAFPAFPLPGVVQLLGVVLVALTWGAGPSLLATLFSALLLNMFVLSPRRGLALTGAQNLVGTLLFLGAGSAACLLASQVELARRGAEQARAEAEVAADRLRMLQAVTDTALAHLGMDELVRELLERLRQTLAVDNVAILLTMPDGQNLTVYSASGPEEQVVGQVRVPIGQGVAGRIAASRAPLVVEDLSSVEVINPLLKEHLRSLAGVPLLVGERLVGVIHMDSAAPRRFTPDEVRLLELVADRVALALDHAQLYEAERRSRAEAATRAQELELTFEAMADGVMVFGADGGIRRMNSAARTLVALRAGPDYYEQSQEARGSGSVTFDIEGRPLPQERWPYVRILTGEVLTGADAADVIVRKPGLEERQINVSGAPVRDGEGHIVGAVCVLHDVTERRRLERRTREALQALLAMAEVLIWPAERVAGGDGAPVATPSLGNTRAVAQRLAELTRNVLGCSRVGIMTVQPETQLVRPLAVVGLAPEQEAQWWAEQEAQPQRFGEGGDPEQTARFAAGKLFVLDLTQPPYDALSNPYGITTLLVAPLRVAERVVGILTLDHSGEPHHYTEEELALAGAVARLEAFVIERERLLEERAAARADALALAAANRRMDEFLGIASHELKTPVTVLQANVQLLARRFAPAVLERRSAEDFARTVASIQPLLATSERSARRLSRLVDDLLDVSRIREGHLELVPEPCNLAAIVREAVEEQQHLQPERVIQLTLPASGTDVTVAADAERIGQVVTNYLTNALKYSPADRPVAVALAVEEARARVSVRDEGPGIPVAEQEQIWELFHRVPGIEVQSGSGVGLGLGLHISREIVERHGGAVGVASAVGAGSTFWFTVPLADA